MVIGYALSELGFWASPFVRIVVLVNDVPRPSEVWLSREVDGSAGACLSKTMKIVNPSIEL